MRKSIAARLAAHRALTEHLLSGDAGANAQVAELGQRVEALGRAVDEDRVLLEEWSKIDN